MLFEVYLGEVFKSSPADFSELDEHLSWLSVASPRESDPRRAVELQNQLHQQGTALSPRDAYVAGHAYARAEPLAHRDGDFDVDALATYVDLIHV